MKTIAALILVSMLCGCGVDERDREGERIARMPGKVIEVRILTASETIVRDDNHPIAGAIIGHEIAGKVGAVVGAIAGSGTKTTTELTNQLQACQISIQTEDGKMHTYHLSSGWIDSLQRCALAEPGDDTTLGPWEYPWD